MKYKIGFDPQLFGEGGDSTAAAAGQTGDNQAVQTGDAVDAQQPDAAAQGKATWDELMKDPDYSRAMSDTVRKAKKAAQKEADRYKANLDAIAPALQLLAEKYGQTGELDYKALAQAITDDTAYYEDMALEMGVPVEYAQKMVRQEAEIASYRAEKERSLEEQRLQQHFAGIQQQAAELKRQYPSFDLGEELKNPAFLRMTSPEGGLTVQQAYQALHFNELMAAERAATQQLTTAKISRTIQAGQNRPAEHGTGTPVKNATGKIKAADLTEAQWNELFARAERGERIRSLDDIF